MQSNSILELIFDVYPQYTPQMGCFIAKASKLSSVRFYEKLCCESI